VVDDDDFAHPAVLSIACASVTSYTNAVVRNRLTPERNRVARGALVHERAKCAGRERQLQRSAVAGALAALEEVAG
jgi:hypothetical protein